MIKGGPVVVARRMSSVLGLDKSYLLLVHHNCKHDIYTARKVSILMSDGVLTNKDTYLPVTLKCAQEFVLVMFHSYNALTNRHDIVISHV